jgi:peptide/nickel transport system permease protein
MQVTGPLSQAAIVPPEVQTIQYRALDGARRLWRTSKLLLVVEGILLLALLGALLPGVLSRYDPNEIHPETALNAPSWEYWLGTDEFGRDVLSRIIFGSQIVLLISVASVAVAGVIGTPLGLVSGMYSGWADAAIMRTQDALLSFPALVFSILIVAALGASPLSTILSIGFLYTPRFARLVRGSVLVLKDLEFVVASRACGATDSRIMFKTILPNCMAPLLVQITLGLATAISIEAGLSYLGLGVQPPTATWGTMLRDGQRYMYLAPWYTLSPGAAIFILVLALNFFGDRIQDALDPRLRGR